MPIKKLIPVLALLLLGAVGCESRTDKSQTGGVEISVSDFDGLPVIGSVNAPGGLIQIDTLTLQSISKDPFAPTSDLMNVELYSYEVTFSRADEGTRVPPTLVRGIFGTVPVNGTNTIDGLPVLDSEALRVEPLSDLFFENGGLDSETGNDFIRLNYTLVFFGRTISGDEIRSGPANFTIEMCGSCLIP
ncbi:MAG: hypothetical protein AAF690_21815 [Acidobacteriota bacterium]